MPVDATVLLPALQADTSQAQKKNHGNLVINDFIECPSGKFEAYKLYNIGMGSQINENSDKY